MFGSHLSVEKCHLSVEKPFECREAILMSLTIFISLTKILISLNVAKSISRNRFGAKTFFSASLSALCREISGLLVH